MRIRSILYILFIASFVGIFFYSNIPSEKADEDSYADSIKKSSIQLYPLPTILSKNSGTQNTILYDLLLNKSEEKLILYDAELSLGNISKILPFETDHLVLEFKYNSEKSRLEFIGSDLESNRIHGYCIITNKNNIKYSVNVENKKYNLEIVSIHNPNSESSEYIIEGSFKLNSKINDLLYFVTNLKNSLLENKETSVRGEFFSKGDRIEFSNVKLENYKLNIGGYIDLSIPAPLFKIDVYKPDINLDEIKDTNFGFKDVELFQDLLQFFAKFNFQINLSSDLAIYNAMSFKKVSLSLKSKNNAEVELNDLYFEFDDKSSLVAQGVLSNNKFYPHYKGSFNLNKVQYKNLAKLFNLEPAKFKNKKNIDISSDVYLHPSLLLLNNITISEGRKILEAKRLQYSSVNSNRSVLTGDIKIDKNILTSNVVNAFIGKYLDVESKSNESGIIDMNLSLVKSLGSKKSREIFLNYIYDNELSMHNISIPQSHINANIEINSKSQKFAMNLDAKKFDLDVLHSSMQDIAYLGSFSGIASKFFPKQMASISNIPGYIDIKLNNEESNSFKGLDCKLNYANNKSTFSNCALKTSGGIVYLSGKIGKGKNNMYYDVSYRGNKISLWPAVINKIDNEVVQVPDSKFDFQGYVESRGSSASELSKNMIGSMAVKFFDLGLRNVNHSNKTQVMHSSSGTKDDVLDLVKGNFDFTSSFIKSNNIEYLAQDSTGGTIDLKIDFHRNSTEINFMQNKGN